MKTSIACLDMAKAKGATDIPLKPAARIVGAGGQHRDDGE
uniref:Uncharacterized protein n=1 Tax=Sphingomonas sp. JE1 TaxID=1628059 RepID=A0A0D5A016_9SPHN|nr:hypothetical protein pJE1_109 [Sphingomonas sp. JE1]